MRLIWKNLDFFSKLGHSMTDRPKKSRNYTRNLRFQYNFLYRVIRVVDSRCAIFSLLRRTVLEISPRATSRCDAKLFFSSANISHLNYLNYIKLNIFNIAINQRLKLRSLFLKTQNFGIFYIVFKNILRFFKMWPSTI